MKPYSLLYKVFGGIVVVLLILGISNIISHGSFTFVTVTSNMQDFKVSRETHIYAEADPTTALISSSLSYSKPKDGTQNRNIPLFIDVSYYVGPTPVDTGEDDLGVVTSIAQGQGLAIYREDGKLIKSWFFELNNTDDSEEMEINNQIQFQPNTVDLIDERPTKFVLKDVEYDAVKPENDSLQIGYGIHAGLDWEQLENGSLVPIFPEQLNTKYIDLDNILIEFTNEFLYRNYVDSFSITIFLLGTIYFYRKSNSDTPETSNGQ